MKFRKILNLPNKKQSNIILSDIATVESRCAVIAKSEHKELIESNRFHDQNCPNCKLVGDVVNRIVCNFTTITNESLMGFNIITNMKSSLLEVNHCNHCGSEWTKSRFKDITSIDIMVVALKYLSQYIDASTTEWSERKNEVIQVFGDCHAESIYRLIKTNKKRMHPNIKSKLSLNRLRQLYPSIYK